jgi:NAD(P)-dependent dehydrogenase (short-subunit alcohol dehydrogenase family)
MADQQRVALITGASSGIGRACADKLASSGWTVTGASRRGTEGTGWTGMVADVTSDAAVRTAVESVIARSGRIDALIASAGYTLAGAAESTPIAEAKEQFDTNFWGCVRAVQAVLPHMRRQRSGRIVLISSIGGAVGLPFQAYYSASKFALEGFAEALAYEVAPFGVYLTLVQPGNIATNATANRVRATAADDGGAYGPALTKAITTMERDEVSGPPAQIVAATVQRVLDSTRPPLRVSVGRPGERVALIAKRLLPFRVFRSAAKSGLGVD